MENKIFKAALIFLTLLAGYKGYTQKKNIKTETFKVYGTCDQCKHRIETTLMNERVAKASWSVESKMLTVSYDSTRFNKQRLEKKLADAGHDTEDFQATDEAYFSLPKCCYYDRYKKQEGMNLPDSLQKTVMENNQHTVTGVVLEEDAKGNLLPLVSATVYNMGSGHTVTADKNGVFQMISALPAQLVISYTGFKADTITVSSPDEIKVILKNKSSMNLQTVVVSAKNQSTYISSLSTFNTLNIGSRELIKAACCNLSESFETSPSVDVSYTDAITGIRQIQLLGLSGNYTQLLTENTPEIKGLAGSYGLTFIPGPWLEGLQLTKGIGSVVNGYESISGQINIEEKKPDKAERFFFNAYGNSLGRLETSIDLAKKINDKWSTALLTHVNGVILKSDDNHDGFLDIPLGRQFNFINRWKYQDTRGVIAQLSLKLLNDHRRAGQTDFDPSVDQFTTNHYGVGIDVQQWLATGKIGYVFPQKKYKSIGFIFSAGNYTGHSYFGLTRYDGKQHSVYANLIYQSIIGTTANKFRTGFSFSDEYYHENLNATVYGRTEVVPGIFFEYNYTGKNFSAIAGLRVDHHNQFGFIATPRLHLKYDFSPNTNLRLSAGRGFRMANIFAENQGLLASARQYNIVNPSNEYGYGLMPEKAWNYGLNLVHNFTIQGRKASIDLDAYHTQFTNQTIVDIDANPQKILFYDLRGRSYSNSLQAELNMLPAKNLELRLAYRWLDVKTTYTTGLLEKPLTAKQKAFINLAYQTGNHWKFDITAQWFGMKRLPNTSGNPVDKQMGDHSPAYFQLMGQVTKQFGKRWELYLGGENLTNYTQKNLIIDAANPFSNYFDASIVWGPVNGRIIYTGVRFRIQ